jgi:GNAT superfamily N-acetyltransferase
MSEDLELPGQHLAIRLATTNDVAEILRLRRAMYEDMGYDDASALSKMVSVSSDYLVRAIADGSFRAWLAIIGGRVVAGGAILICPGPAHPYDPECRRATILNVYTDPQFRRRGLSRCLMEIMIDWCRHEGFAGVTLHASPDGRHLYESLGFEPSNEMRLKLR